MQQQEENTLDLRRFWRAARQWRWLLISGALFVISAGIWLAVRAIPNYDVHALLLVGDNSSDKDASAGSVSQMMRSFSVGGFSATAVNNEVLILSSYDVMLRTVRAMDLNRVYIATDRNGDRSRLWKETPIRIEAPAEHFDTLSTAIDIKIKLKETGKVDIKATKGLFKRTIAEVNDATLPMILKTPFGSYNIMPTDNLEHTPYTKLNISVMGNTLAANLLSKQTEMSVPDKLSDVIAISYVSNNPKLGCAVVDAIMGEYNAKRRERLHEASDVSIKYYDERIAETFKQLQASEKEITEYKRKNELMGLDSELGILVGDAYGSRRDIRSTHYNLAYYETVLDILRNRLNDDVIIPAVENIGDANIEAFNAAIHARRDLRRSATEDNEVLIRLNERIEELRDLIIENSEKQLAKYKKDLTHKEQLAAMAESRLDSFPDYQLELLNISRDKGHLSSLYSYLVNQRENAVLQRYSTANIGFVFQPAYIDTNAGLIKTLFKACLIPIIFAFLALFCAIFWTTLMMLCSRKIKDPMDLSKMGIEDQSVKFAGNNDAIQQIRNLIVANPTNKIIYSSCLNETNGMRSDFISSLTAIGRTVEQVSGFSSNDDILTPESQNRIVTATESADFVVVAIPDPEKIFDLVNVIDTDSACLLISLKSGKVSRKELKKILKGQTADKIFTIIEK